MSLLEGGKGGWVGVAVMLEAIMKIFLLWRNHTQVCSC